MLDVVPVGVSVQVLVVFLVGGEIALYEGVVERVMVQCFVLLFFLLFWGLDLGLFLLAVINLHLL